MSSISLRLPAPLLSETERLAHVLHVPRAEYVRRALAVMNAEVVKQQRRERMMAASQRVRKDSMRINAEFAAIEHAPDRASATHPH